MCGIAVSWNPDIESMIRRMKHRGIVNNSIIRNDILFGHIRLPIQGLNPKFNGPFETNKYITLYNGEIYNYKEIDSSFECDIQVFTEDKNISEFDGDFAVVKYNKEKKLFEVLTDRFGKKQLYYRYENGRVSAIASEIKSLLKSTDTLNEHYMATVSRFGYVFGSEYTIVKNISKFLPGKKYIINKLGYIVGICEIQWDSEKQINHIENKSLITELMEISVKRRLVSDIPLCLIYSGGLDSSIILYHLHNMDIKLKIFTLSDNVEDLSFAEKYAEELGYKLNVVKSEENDYYEAHYANECAVDLGSVVPKYSLFKAIKREGFNVAIGGSGADEVFGGYKRTQLFDTQQNDIYNELIYYHLPRLDKTSMANTVEYRTPYTADYVIDKALRTGYNNRIDKRALRNAYKLKLPDYIVNRPKEPLKSSPVRENKEIERINLLKYFRDKIFPEMKNEGI